MGEVFDLLKFEEKYIQARQKFDIIQNPNILCAASEQYTQPNIGFDLDVAVLKKAFPNRVEIEKRLSSKKLRELLVNNNFDIVHLVLATSPENGDLIFSPIDFETLETTTPSPDIMSAEGFADLLVESNTKLVVLATCNALLLAVEVAHVSNMAASDSDISGKAVEEWADCFYNLLANGKSLFKAFDLTKSQCKTPIRAIRKQDVAFALSKS